MHHSSKEDFKTINWLPVDQRAQQSLNVTLFKYVNNLCPYYMEEDSEYASQGRISSRNNSARDLIFLFEKLIYGRKVCHILVWNKFPSSMKRNISLNTFKYDVRKLYLHKSRMQYYYHYHYY